MEDIDLNKDNKIRRDIKSIFDILNNNDEEKNESGYKYVNDKGVEKKEKDSKNDKIDKKKKEILKKARKKSYKDNVKTLDKEDYEKEDTDKEKEDRQGNSYTKDEEILKIEDILRSLKVPEKVMQSFESGNYKIVQEYLKREHGIRFDEKIISELYESEDWRVVADVLSNSVDDGLVNEDEFVDILINSTRYSEKELRKIFRAYLEVDPMDRFDKLSRLDNFEEWINGVLESKINKKEKVDIEEGNYKIRDGKVLGIMGDDYATVDYRKWDKSLIVYETEDNIEIKYQELADDNLVKFKLISEEENVERDIYIDKKEVNQILARV